MTADQLAGGPPSELAADDRVPGSKEAILTTGSGATRVIGIIALLSTAAMLAFGLLISPPDVVQGDSVRLFYVHVPVATVALYLAFTITLVGSIIYLFNGSTFWDLLAGASAEVGVVFLGLTLITGMIWGRPTWGSYWEWDPRLTSTAVSFVLYLGYLAVRNLDMDPAARSRRAAVLGIVGSANTIIVKFSVTWWRSLHQGSTLKPLDMQIEGLMWFSFFLGSVAMLSIFAWLVLHRFRLAWLQHRVDTHRLESALRERRREGEAGAGRTQSEPGGNLATGGA